MHAVADNGRDIGLAIGEVVNAHAGIDPEALIMEITENFTGVFPVISVGAAAVGVDQNAGGADETAHFVEPTYQPRKLYPLLVGIVEDNVRFTP